VFTSVADPIASGVAVSLARPGGNVTGLTNVTIELAAKQLQLLKEAFPNISRVAIFVDTRSPLRPPIVKKQTRRQRAWHAGICAEVRNSEDVEKNVGLSNWRADSMFVLNNPTNFNNRKRLIQIAGEVHLPAIYGSDSYAESGGLMSYGSNDNARWQQGARFVDKILRGAKPADLPVEQPTIFELVINLKTAKALGLKIPQSIVLRADRVIQ
jgi:putative ABC transport system substrate-binding protein